MQDEAVKNMCTLTVTGENNIYRTHLQSTTTVKKNIFV